MVDHSPSQRLVTEAALAMVRDRSTHTGTQVAATISDLTEAVQDAVAALLAAGTGVVMNYNDAGNTLTVTSTGSGGVTDPEVVRDTIGAALIGTGVVSVTLNDAADTITISSTATANATDAALRARSSHTGTQLASTISDFNTAVAGLITGKADKSGSIRQFADVDPTVLTDGAVYQYDADTNMLTGVDLATQFAAVDVNGRILNSARSLYSRDLVVTDEGQQPPANFPPGGIWLTRPPQATLVPLAAGANFAQGSGTCAVTTTADFAVGDTIAFAIGSSGEVTLPSTYTVTYATGAGAKTLVVSATQPGTSQADIHYARVTTAIPTGTTVTITANQNRVHLMVQLVKMVNLASTAAADVTATAAGSPSSPLALTIGPSPTTAQISEIALVAVAMNTSSPAIRSAAGINGWSAVGSGVVSAAASGRGLFVASKVLTSAATVTATMQVTSSDGTNGAWCGALATFKAA